MKKTISVFISILFTLSVCMCGCSVFDDGSGKNIYYPISSDASSFDPQIAVDEASSIVAENCFEGLVKYNEQGKIVPGVAESWDISSDNLTYTFHLNKNAKWHVGSGAQKTIAKYTSKSIDTRVVAEDFVFGLKRYFDPETNTKADSRLYLIENAPMVATGSMSLSELGITAVDSHTLKITLSSPSDTFLSVLTSSAAMPCREEFFLATKGRYGLSCEYIICNGPFYLSEHSESVYICLTKNDDYHEVQKVLPSNIYLYINSDSRLRINKLETGTYDACYVDIGEKNSIKDKKITYKSYSNSTWAFCFNCLSENLYNRELRLAVCHATDMSVIEMPDYVSGYAEGLIPDLCMVGESIYREIAGKADFVAFDANLARSYFDKSLVKLEKSSVSATLICPKTLENQMRKLVQLWQKNLSLNFKIVIEPLETEEIDKRISEDNFDIAFTCIQTKYSSAADFLADFSQTGNYAVFNFTSLSYQESVENALKAVNSQDMAQKCSEAEAILLQNGVVYPVFKEEGYLALAKNVSGIYLAQAGVVPVFESGRRID